MVCVRKRPINRDEEASGQADIVTVSERERLVVVHEPKVRVDMTKYIEDHEYCFDDVFDEQSTNRDVYERTAKPLVKCLFNKGKATCFAYGQTGSGKTYTMSGNGDGLYMQAAEDIYSMLDTSKYGIWISYFEIYGGVLFDLLNERKKLVAREDAKHRVCIVGLEEHHAESADAFFDLMEYGNSVRSVGATAVNADSSRSHAILQIVLKDLDQEREQGKLSFIDLAGSERAQDTSDSDRRRRMEGAAINQSLLALKECIRAMDQAKSHTPFRQSVLTKCLRDSFTSRQSRTVMIATVSPASYAGDNTLNTLRYADRVKELSKGGGGSGGGRSDARKKENKRGGNRPARPSNRRASDRHAPGRRGADNRGADVPPRRSKPSGRGAAASEHQDREPRRRARKPVTPAAVEDLVDTHAELVTVILQEKESLILAHRQQIDDMMELVKDEMRLLHAVDQPASAVDDYVVNLQQLLSQKMSVIQSLQQRLARFQGQLEQEEDLSKSLERSLPRV